MGKIKQKKNKHSFLTNNINMLSFILFWGGLMINIFFFFILDNFDSGGIMSSNPSYSWEVNSSLAMVGLFVFLMAGVVLSDVTNKYNKFITSLCLFIFVLLLKPFMFLMDAELQFAYTPVEQQYVDKNTGQINNVEKYTSLMLKYCKKWKDKTCNGKYAEGFQTLEDYVYVLDFANTNNYRDLYQFTVNLAERQGKLKQLIRQYNDDTFYAFLIKEYGTNQDIRLLIEPQYKNASHIYIYIKKNDRKIANYEYWNKLSTEINRQIKLLPNINKNLF